MYVYVGTLCCQENSAICEPCTRYLTIILHTVVALWHTRKPPKTMLKLYLFFFQLRWQYHWRNFFPVFKGLFGLPIITVIGYLSIFGILIFKNTGVTASFSNYRKYHTSANTEVRYFCMFKTTLFSSHVRHGYLCITLSLSYFWNCFSMVNIYWCIMLHC